MSKRKRKQPQPERGGTLWNTPAGGPSPFDNLKVPPPEELERISREVAEKIDEELEKNPVYRSFKRGEEASRRLRNPTWYWARPWR